MRPEEGLQELLQQVLQQLSFGSVILTLQDGRVLQVEKREVFRLPHPVAKEAANASPDTVQVVKRILTGLGTLAYGRMELKVQGGRVTQVETTAKLRGSDWQGMDGDGI
nr:DUF2292 domain-containing protein [uncultured Anaeromusa sp.]